MNRFVFIVSFRNVENFIKQCADSIINQNYKNWISIFCDDASEDRTCENIPKDERFTIIKRPERLTALMNILLRK